MKELKQSHLSEHAKLLKELEDERVKLQEDRARMEIAKTLQSKNSDDSGLSRAEIDASIKYAEVNNFSSICLFTSLLGYINADLRNSQE